MNFHSFYSLSGNSIKNEDEELECVRVVGGGGFSPNHNLFYQQKNFVKQLNRLFSMVPSLTGLNYRN